MHDVFYPAVQACFNGTFSELMGPQQLGWPAIARGDSTLNPAPTGTGKTLTVL